jgi:hypothetical protein
LKVCKNPIEALVKTPKLAVHVVDVDNKPLAKKTLDKNSIDLKVIIDIKMKTYVK